MSTSPLVYSPRYECDIGAHVFPTQKFRGTVERLRAEGLIGEVHAPTTISRELCALVHTDAYLDDFFALRATERVRQSELPITAEIRDAYLLAAGGTLQAARIALESAAAMHVGGGYHHAMADHAEGFCYLNDIAIAIRALQQEGRIERAAVIDTDVHQGNGTARIFQDDPTVFTFSIHQENNYPVKERSDLDIGLADRTGDATYLALLEDAVPRLLDQHEPQLVVMVAGADPYVEDQLGGLSLTLDGLRARDHLIVNACAARSVPVVGVTAGGYARELADTIAIHANTVREILQVSTSAGR